MRVARRANQFFATESASVRFAQYPIEHVTAGDALWHSLAYTPPRSEADQLQWESLQDRLTAALTRILELQASPRDKRIVEQLWAGKTQAEIARQENLNQANISRAMWEGRSGLYQRCRRAANRDPEVIQLRKELSELG